MNTNYNNTANQFSNVRPNLVVQESSGQMVTGQALANCANFTANSASLLHPKYSLTLIGLTHLFASPGGSYNFLPIFGMLELMAAPVQESLRIGGGLAGMVGGAIATMATGLAYTTEFIGRSIFGISPAEHKRQQLMESFVTRMQTNLFDAYKSNTISYMQKKNFMDNPGQLIGITCIMIAFLSKNLEGQKLHTKNGPISKDDIKNMDDNAKKYFKEICDMKEAIQSFKLNENAFTAWTALMQKIQNIDSNNDQNERETLAEIVRIADGLSKLIVEDQMFIDTWNKYKS